MPVVQIHHMFFECSDYAEARVLFKDLLSQQIVSVGQFFNQPDCHFLARYLTRAIMMRMNQD